MTRISQGVLVAMLAVAAPAYAEDPNRWQGWATPDDGQSKGLDVSMVTSGTNPCGTPAKKQKYRVLPLQPRFRNRYQEPIAGKLKVEHEATEGGPQTTLVEFTLAVGETPVISPTVFCHDSRRSLSFTIAELRFPDREAEQARIAAQKAAAEKAAAEKAAAQKAAAEKAAAEQAAAEAARREEAAKLARRDGTAQEAERAKLAAAKAAAERDQQAFREQELAAQRYREQREVAAQAEAKAATQTRLLPPTDRLRRGELSLQIPVGFQAAEVGRTGGSVREAGMSYGLRGELRLFTWLKTISRPNEPLSAMGFELALSGGWAKTIDLQEVASGSSVSVGSGAARARFWYGSFGIGVFGDWLHLARTPSSGVDESYNLFAVGPELAFGIVSTQRFSVEASGRVGAVASGDGLTAGTSDNVFIAGSVVTQLDRYYAGALVTRYHELSAGEVTSTWNALGVLGVRLPW